MAEPDAASEAGKVDWVKLLKNVLPLVDMFVPSVQEVLFMVDRAAYAKLIGRRQGAHGNQAGCDEELLRALSGKLLDWGAAVVMIKLGDQGAYLRTSNDKIRLAGMGSCMPENAGAVDRAGTAGAVLQGEAGWHDGLGRLHDCGFPGGRAEGTDHRRSACSRPWRWARAVLRRRMRPAVCRTGSTMERRVRDGWKTVPSCIRG